MEDFKFKIGDVVYLNSNPEIKMTVYGFTKSKHIAVMYLRNGIRHTSIYMPEILTLYKN